MTAKYFDGGAFTSHKDGIASMISGCQHPEKIENPYYELVIAAVSYFL